jgi:hypothetical protein
LTRQSIASLKELSLDGCVGSSPRMTWGVRAPAAAFAFTGRTVRPDVQVNVKKLIYDAFEK